MTHYIFTHNIHIYIVLYVYIFLNTYIYIYVVTVLVPVTASTIYTTKSCTNNLAKIRHTNATCASQFFILAQSVAT